MQASNNDSGIKQKIRPKSNMVSRCLVLSTLCALIVAVSAQDGKDKEYNFLKPPHCGKSAVVTDFRIINFVATSIKSEKDSWPWMGALGYRNPDGSDKPVFKCSGTLISNKHVLTSAYCALMVPDLYLARFGVSSLTKDQPVDVEVEEKQIHPDYNRQTYANDIAVLTLKRDVSTSDSLRPVCLPHAEPLRSDDFNRKLAAVAGWGAIKDGGPMSDDLMHAYLPVIRNDECRVDYAGLPSLAINNCTICAGKNMGGSNACQGDNGGPLMLSYESHIYEIGLYVYSYKCGERGYPGVYSRVTEHLDFIEEAMNLS